MLQYDDFGPPSAAFELLGQPWWQWQDHGDSRPRPYDIRVVVYRNIEPKDVQKTYAIDPAREQDYRYVEYAAAIEYLDRLIAEDSVASVTATLRATRKRIEKALAGEPCAPWARDAVRKAESAGVPRSYWAVLSSVAEGCDAIPSRLREAARRAAKIKDRKAQAAGLASAAVEVLGPACEIPEPRGSAAELTALCPLAPSDLPIEGQALVHMRAADWGFLIALHQSLNRAQAYGERARRLLLIFTLSAAILGEEETEKAPAR